MNRMKELRCLVHGPMSLFLLSLLLVGCASVQSGDPVNPSKPYQFPGQATVAPTPVPEPAPAVAANPVISQPAPAPVVTAPAPSVAPAQPATTVAAPAGPASADDNSKIVLRPGDTIQVSFSDLPPPGLLPVSTELGADGKITLHHNVQVYALGKTARQLEQEIRSEYVPKYYKYLTTTIRTEMRFYSVNGEVKLPSQYPWRGTVTVMRAIGQAGGFTDWARRKKVQLTRMNGQKFIINCDDALKNPDKDLPVYPGDLIDVPRRGPFGW